MLGAPGERVCAVIARDDVQVLIDTLAGGGYEVLGPSLRNGAINLRRHRRPEGLPGKLDRAALAGRYFVCGR